MAHYLDQGAFYPEGGGQIMSDRLAESIERSGGKLKGTSPAATIAAWSSKAICASQRCYRRCRLRT